MINKLSERRSGDMKDYINYTVKCPCCGTGLNFGKEDVYKDEDEALIHHEYIDCPECNEKIQLSDKFYFGY